MGNKGIRQFEAFYINQGDVVLHRQALAATDVVDALNIAVFRIPMHAKLVKLEEDGNLMWPSDCRLSASCMCSCHCGGFDGEDVCKQPCNECDCD